MKVVLLAGGFGTRLSEETYTIPKPMVEIGERPILWHIMKIYSHYGFNDFIICLGYKGVEIKEYFFNYYLHQANITIDLALNSISVHEAKTEPWKVTLVDTGLHTLTGGRIKRIAKYVGDEDFMLTYGDGLADIDINKLLEFHKAHGKYVTLTAVQPLGRFGALGLDGDQVTTFQEKPKGDGAWINGGFFVCKPKVFDYIEGDSTTWEEEPLETLAREGQVGAFSHNGFWQAMDTLRDKRFLEKLWSAGNAPWKIWK